MTAATYNRKRSGYECVILWRQTKIFFMTLAIVQTMTNPSWFPDRESTRKYRKIKWASIPRVFQLKKHHLPNSSLSSRGHYLALLFRWTAVGEGVPRHFQDPLSRGSLPIRACYYLTGCILYSKGLPVPIPTINLANIMKKSRGWLITFEVLGMSDMLA